MTAGSKKGALMAPFLLVLLLVPMAPGDRMETVGGTNTCKILHVD